MEELWFIEFVLVMEGMNFLVVVEVIVLYVFLGVEDVLLGEVVVKKGLGFCEDLVIFIE